MTPTVPVPTTVRHLDLALLMLRLGVAVVMGVWAADKFVNPGHARAVFENFYGLAGTGDTIVTGIGVLQAVIVVLFMLGLWRTWTYGIVLLMHGASTLASWRQYLEPFDNLLFFAAWPMWAACIALFLLRSHDTLLNLDTIGHKPRA
jgi:hypothetical protein